MRPSSPGFFATNRANASPSRSLFVQCFARSVPAQRGAGHGRRRRGPADVGERLVRVDRAHHDQAADGAGEAGAVASAARQRNAPDVIPLSIWSLARYPPAS